MSHKMYYVYAIMLATFILLTPFVNLTQNSYGQIIDVTETISLEPSEESGISQYKWNGLIITVKNEQKKNTLKSEELVNETTVIKIELENPTLFDTVDNYDLSDDDCFPEVGDQNPVGSCSAWAMTLDCPPHSGL